MEAGLWFLGVSWPLPDGHKMISGASSPEIEKEGRPALLSLFNYEIKRFLGVGT